MASRLDGTVRRLLEEKEGERDGKKRIRNGRIPVL